MYLHIFLIKYYNFYFFLHYYEVKVLFNEVLTYFYFYFIVKIFIID